MAPGYVVALALTVLALVLLRLVGVLPLAAGARTIGRVGAVLAFAGVLGLLFHCLAMFFPPLGRAVPGAGGLAGTVDALGVPSALLYAVPAVLVLVGIRRLHPVAVAVDAAALVAVGITMYDRGPLAPHLVAIAVAVVALAVTGLAVTTGVGRRAAVAA